MASIELLQAIGVTAELTGKVFSENAARILAADLEGYDLNAVLQALSRCRKELKPGQFCAEAVISRIDDGRPGVEEAWAMLPRDESQTVVWTDEMAQAMGVCGPLMDDGDMVAARMAFKETYNRLVTDARNNKIKVKWTPSLGHDKNGREMALVEAAQRGRLSPAHVRTLLPYHEATEQTLALLKDIEVKMLDHD